MSASSSRYTKTTMIADDGTETDITDSVVSFGPVAWVSTDAPSSFALQQSFTLTFRLRYIEDTRLEVFADYMDWLERRETQRRFLRAGVN